MNLPSPDRPGEAMKKLKAGNRYKRTTGGRRELRLSKVCLGWGRGITNYLNGLAKVFYLLIHLKLSK